ncbi:MAG: bifunctional riboflavin kinase/FAD synthetase [Candidatus Delongbacteria bacterium]|nr:bifunctional riboflavin kinase/FAD synthetase [Candidatus Delongbacteria bacterium]MBN2836231.1 bifunctional riboflavin kinase/FAD synthetase [Candidatus Delongbacteria bacterium]
MEICNIKDVKESVVLTLGSFDGIHKGHIKLIEELKQSAKLLQCKSAVMTFRPHPREVVNPDFQIKYLTVWSEKVDLLKKLDIDYLIVEKFDKQMMNTEPKFYFENHVLKNLNVKRIVTGFNHHFGSNRSGGKELLVQLGDKYNFDVVSVDPFIIDNKTVSSTLIRDSVSKWDGLAKDYLGRYYFIDGVVEHGKKRGRGLGFPTINLSFENEKKLRPSSGVYLTVVRFDQSSYFGLTNIGFKPTFNEKGETVETHILNFSRECYDEKVRIFFIEKIRDEKKFDNPEKLKEQLITDRENCIKIIESLDLENFDII